MHLILQLRSNGGVGKVGTNTTPLKHILVAILSHIVYIGGYWLSPGIFMPGFLFVTYMFR